MGSVFSVSGLTTQVVVDQLANNVIGGGLSTATDLMLRPIPLQAKSQGIFHVPELSLSSESTFLKMSRDSLTNGYPVIIAISTTLRQ